jgi:2,5-dihydroxypyridine 5,6-dioxygenase
MIERLPELMRAIRVLFDSCQVQPEESVVVYIDSRRMREVGDLFLGEARARGCDAAQVWVESRGSQVEPPRAAIEAMKAANVVFDISSSSWLYTPANGEVIRTGHTRMLQVFPPESRLIERPAIPSIIRKAVVAGEIFNSAPNQTVHITSSLGTDLIASYKGRRVNPQDGAVLKPGDWDSQGMGFANCFPIEDSAQGRVVFNGPCYLSGGHSFITTEGFSVTIEDGRIVDIQGGVEARHFQRWIDSYDDPQMRVVAHLGFGYDRRAGPPPKPVETGDHGSWESMNGGVIVAFGANYGRSGGQNRAPSHCDLVLLGANFFVDDVQVLRDGEFTLDGWKD